MRPPVTALLPVTLALLPWLVGGWTAGQREPVDVLEAGARLARWSAGTNASYSDGLKGGIAWALDPALCDHLTPLFPEETEWRKGLFGFWQYGMPELLRCDHLKATIRTAMRSWEAANSNIRFFEVTTLCDQAWTTPGDASAPSPPPTFPPLSPPEPSPELPPPNPPATRISTSPLR